MRRLFVGIDSGTQSTKVVVVDGDVGRVVAERAAAHQLLPSDVPGAREQAPSDWIEAARTCLTSVLAAQDVRPADILAVGISGQQHGLVALDETGAVIRPAKLWCDTSTAAEADAIVQRLGGLDRTIAALGNAVPPGFTASKVLWLKEHEPAHYARLHRILLPHDYLAFWLTGAQVMEWGDASGTGLMDVRTRTWATAVLDAIDSRLFSKLPPLVHPRTPAGVIKSDLARAWGLRPDVLVTGSGDNMMGAVGTGNVREGVVTASLGTSGTIYACSERPIVDPRGEIAAFCDATGRWLPLVCTMNVTVATGMVSRLFGLDHEGMTRAAAQAPPGSDGLVLVPFFEGERTPNLPDATGVWIGVRDRTFDVAHMARAAIEGVTLGLNYGLNRLRSLGVSPVEVRLTGGGARNSLWRQVAADVFGCPVVCPAAGEGAALGAALHAQWAWGHATGTGGDIGELTDRFVRLDEATRAEPRTEAAATYRELQALFDETAAHLPAAFALHRRIIAGGRP